MERIPFLSVIRPRCVLATRTFFCRNIYIIYTIINIKQSFQLTIHLINRCKIIKTIGKSEIFSRKTVDGKLYICYNLLGEQNSSETVCWDSWTSPFKLLCDSPWWWFRQGELIYIVSSSPKSYICEYSITKETGSPFGGFGGFSGFRFGFTGSGLGFLYARTYLSGDLSGAGLFLWVRFRPDLFFPVTGIWSLPSMRFPFVPSVNLDKTPSRNHLFCCPGQQSSPADVPDWLSSPSRTSSSPPMGIDSNNRFVLSVSLSPYNGSGFASSPISTLSEYPNQFFSMKIATGLEILLSIILATRISSQRT